MTYVDLESINIPEEPWESEVFNLVKDHGADLVLATDRHGRMWIMRKSLMPNWTKILQDASLRIALAVGCLCQLGALLIVFSPQHVLRAWLLAGMFVSFGYYFGLRRFLKKRCAAWQ